MCKGKTAVVTGAAGNGMGRSIALTLDLTGGMTLEAWVKPADTGTGTGGTLMDLLDILLGPILKHQWMRLPNKSLRVAAEKASVSRVEVPPCQLSDLDT